MLQLFLRRRSAPNPIETDVESAALLIVDGSKGFGRDVVLQIKNATGLFGRIEDMQERP